MSKVSDFELFNKRCVALSIINKYFEEKYYKEIKNSVLTRIMIDLRKIKNNKELQTYFLSGIEYIKDDTRLKVDHQKIVTKEITILLNNNSYLHFEENNVENIVKFIMEKYFDNFKKDLLEIYELSYNKSLCFY